MQKRKVQVVAYDASWPEKFEALRQNLLPVLEDVVISIEHIGSTSVPNLAAKPIIDVLIEVTSLEALEQKTKTLREFGLVPKGENGIAGRRYFQIGGIERTHNIHAFQSDSPHLLPHRAFCAYLVAHRKVAQEYAAVKQRAVLLCEQNMNSYMALKNDFIAHHLPLAIRWFQSNNE